MKYWEGAAAAHFHAFQALPATIARLSDPQDPTANGEISREALASAAFQNVSMLCGVASLCPHVADTPAYSVALVSAVDGIAEVRLAIGDC